jgi:hypothetical protein
MFKGKIFNKIKYKEISNLRYYNLETIMGLWKKSKLWHF